MTDITIRFELKLSRGFIAAGAALLAAAGAFGVRDLWSENVTMTTYYPAPSGIYVQMITTGNTFLSRDGGHVDVGTTAPLPPSAKMAVMGGRVGIGTTGPLATLHVNGTAIVDGQIRIDDGSESFGRVLTSDASGYARWADLPPACYGSQGSTQ